MFRRIWFICALTIFAVMANAAATITPKKPSKVSGCYQIFDAAELYGFASIVNGTDGFEMDSVACGKLMEDIVVNENVLTASGDLNTADTANFAKWTPLMHFEGSFDGRGHTISGLYFNSDSAYFVGLIGLIRYHTTTYRTVDIKNLGVVGSFFRGDTDVGSIVGAQLGPGSVNLEHVYSDSRVEGKNSAVGGLIGMATGDLFIYRCYNSGNVFGKTNVGGVAGYSVGSIASLGEVYNTGSVSCIDDSPDCADMGGIAGYVVGVLELFNSYNLGTISGKYAVGGILGTVIRSSYIIYVYNSGDISGTEHVGGIGGSFFNVEHFDNGYNLGNVSGTDKVGGILGWARQIGDWVNFYNAGAVTLWGGSLLYVGSILGLAEEGLSEFTIENVFHLGLVNSSDESPGVAVTSEMMENGSLAYLLHNYYFDNVDASVWGQKVGVDPFPNFSGTVTGVPSDALEDLVLHSCEGDASVLPEKYVPGYVLRLPKKSCEGLGFLGWYDNAEFSGDAVDVIPATATGKQEFWGRFGNVYSITYETNGGTLDSAAAKSYVRGDSVALLDPQPRNGYVFRGWYESEDFTGKRAHGIGTAESGNKVFYARWFKKESPAFDNGCYVITNASELYGFAAIMNATDGMPIYGRCGELANDIVVNEGVLTAHGSLNVADTAEFIKWTPIDFRHGKFDGHGHTISGLYYKNDSLDFAGFFSMTDTAEIRNLGIVESYFKGYWSVGGIAGRSLGPLTLENVYNDSRVEASGSSVGGLVGYMTYNYEPAQIKNCYNLGPVAGKGDVGGLVGYINVSDTVFFINVYNAGPVTTLEEGLYSSYVGGIAGYSWSALYIQNGYNVGTISGKNYTGGIIGAALNPVIFVNVYNVGNIVPLDEYGNYMDPIVGYTPSSSNRWNKFENVFYQNDENGGNIGSAVTSEMIENGLLAYLLHNYYYKGVDASVWGQNVGVDDYPNFSGIVTNVSSDALEDVVMHSCEGGTPAVPEKYVPGYALWLPEVSCEDYLFLGWYDNAEFSGEPVKLIDTTATGKQEFWGKFGTVYSITYETNGGVPDSAIESYVSGLGAPLPKNVSRDGYIFTGWFESEDFSGERLSEISAGTTGDKVLYARWFKKEIPSQDDNGCYVIENAAELYGFAAIVNGTDGYDQDEAACAYLDNDIVVNENVLDQDGNINEADSSEFLQWTPINEFEGVFNGKGHVIRGLYLNQMSSQNACDGEYGCGFFGSLAENVLDDTVVVENLGIEDSYFAYDDYTLGALVGIVLGRYYWDTPPNVRISNCYSASTVVAMGDVGGIVGMTTGYSSVVIENCYNTGRIVAQSYTTGGGLVGSVRNTSLKLKNCYNVGEVLVGYSQKSGRFLIGYEDVADVENSYYLKTSDDEEEHKGYAVTSERFENGTVALLLHDAENGSIWGQNVGVDPLPNFSKKVKNSTVERYNVTFHTFDGDTAYYFKTYIPGIPRSLPDTSLRTGYELEGWYSDSALSSRARPISATDEGDRDFYAKWTPVFYNVRAYASVAWKGEVVGVNSSQFYMYGDTVELEAVPFDGYKFDYWRDNVENTNAVRKVVIVSDTAFVAYFSVVSSSSVSSSSAKSSSSSVKAKSSSSSAKLSSSSKKAKSSSSKKHDSSDNDGKSSSSCSGDKCGKDLPITFELVCNGKKCSEALSAEVAVPQFRVIVVGRDIQVMEARVGSPYALFDLQGGLVRSGQVGSVDFTIPAPHSGSYLVRIGNRIKRVTVR